MLKQQSGWSKAGWPSRLAVIALGAVSVFGFAPYHIWGLALLSLIGLFIRLQGVSRWERPGRAGFNTGLLFGLGWFSAGCFWITSAFIERGAEFLIFVPPLVGGLAVLLSLFWGGAGLFTARIMARHAAPHWSGVTAFVGCLMLAELARGHVLTGFPWQMAGYIFEPGGWISQSASLFGIYGLTMSALLISALLGHAALQRDILPALASVGIIFAMVGFGATRLNGASDAVQPGVTLRLVTVPFRQSEMINPQTSFEIVNRFIDESVQPGLTDVTHLVWPEGAVSGVAIENESLLRAMGRELALIDDTPPVWIMNSLRQEISPHPKTAAPRPLYYNSSVAITFDGLGNPAVAASSDKRKLVPFGEFIPGGEVVEDMGARLVSTALSSITPAKDKRSVLYPGLPPINAQICYEVIFSGLIARGGDNDPQAIFNQSNDAWFGPTIGPDQHAAISRYRAIEEGLPLIRAAANGVTGSFDSYGRVVEMVPRNQSGFVDTVLPSPIRRVQRGPSRIVLVNCALGLLNLVLLLLGAVHRPNR